MTDKRDKFEDRTIMESSLKDNMMPPLERVSPAETSADDAFDGHNVRRPAGYEEFDEYLVQSENEIELTKPFGTYCMEVDKAFHAKILPSFQARVTQLHELTSHKGTIAVPLTVKDCWKLINDLESYLLMEVYNKSLQGVAQKADMTPEYEMARAVYLAVMDKEHNGRNPHAYKC
ncbi:hypothetical protein VPHD13_0188 [Vibrio phage D13]